MNITGQATILKDDKGSYKTSIMTKELDKDGNEQLIFMRIKVGFRNGVSVKHKTKINIKEGFLTFFRIETGNTYDDGTKEYKKYPKIMIMNFDVIEDGVNEVYHAREYNENQNQSSFSDDSMGDYYPDMSNDELPF